MAQVVNFLLVPACRRRAIALLSTSSSRNSSHPGVEAGVGGAEAGGSGPPQAEAGAVTRPAQRAALEAEAESQPSSRLSQREEPSPRS